MTRQYKDSLTCNNEKLYVQYKTLDSMFNPYKYGIRRSGMSTANWKGFHCDYVTNNEELYLNELHLVGNKISEESLQNA